MATDIPELRQHIARYLDFDTLKAFSLVCKAWNLDAHPVLWQRSHCRIPWWKLMFPDKNRAWLHTFRKNAPSLRHIYNDGHNEPIAPKVCETLLEQCHGLITVEAILNAIDGYSLTGYWEEVLRPLIEQNKNSMRRLWLRAIKKLSIGSLRLPSLLANLPSLRSLELGVPSVMVEDLLPILDACPTSLEHLVLSSSVGRRRHLDSVTHPRQSHLRLKRLRIDGACYENTLEDILSRLAVHSLEEFELYTAFALQACTLSNTFWRLTRLDLQKMRPGPERILPQILDAIHPHQLRHVHLGKLSTECVAKLIEQQNQSLETLDVSFKHHHAKALSDILATCGKLKSLIFAAQPYVDIRALIDSQRPWVCTELEAFEGVFGLSPPLLLPRDPSANKDAECPRQVEIQFMQRLGQLTKLRRLTQRYDALGQTFHVAGINRDADTEIMGWSLSTGLEYLDGLARLQTLRLLNRPLPKGIGIPEMIFIKRHWDSLEEIACQRIRDNDLKEWLATDWPELKVTLG
ncbi:hypothetical protein BGX34_008359 [Mortierella sp. NVP85]|nr:hypothetical protein BGX34_008359 [Mortierella sp. NVP85]